MSAWVLALGLCAGYLMNKKLAIASRLQVEAAQPVAVARSELASARKHTDQYGHMNVKLPKREKDELVQQQQRAQEAVQQFEASSSCRIVGVPLELGV